MNGAVKGKQGTRGQKQIYEENQETIRYYFFATAIVSPLVASLYFFFFSPPGSAYWITWSLTVVIAGGAVLMMMSMVKAVRNEKQQVVDAGMDLNDPGAFGEYCKDAVILSCLAQMLSLLWSGFIYLIVLLPAYALFKLWTKVLGPWFFAAPPEEDAVDEKKLRKQQRTKFVRR